jgi:hypothetical protein
MKRRNVDKHELFFEKVPPKCSFLHSDGLVSESKQIEDNLERMDLF